MSVQRLEMPHFGRYSEFWPFYVSQHAKPWTRRVHASGTVLAAAVLGCFLHLGYARSGALSYGLFAVPIVAYGFAWTAHSCIERNTPATFGGLRACFYSLTSDFRMVALMGCCRMDAEVERCSRLPEWEAWTAHLRRTRRNEYGDYSIIVGS